MASLLVKRGASFTEPKDKEGLCPMDLVAGWPRTGVARRADDDSPTRVEATELLVWGHDSNFTMGIATGKQAGSCTLKTPVVVSLPSERPSGAAAVDGPSGAVVPGEAEDGDQVRAVCNGKFHSLTLTTSGRVWANGVGTGGRLGLGHEKTTVLPAVVGGALCAARVISIAAGLNHSLAATDDGQVFAWGAASCLALGFRATEDQLTPRRVAWTTRRTSTVSTPGEQHARGEAVVITAVAAGDAHSLALSATGVVYSWGDNSRNALGYVLSLGASGPTGPASGGAQLWPRRVELLDGGRAPTATANVVGISAASNLSAAVTREGSVLYWGDEAGAQPQRLRIEQDHRGGAGLLALGHVVPAGRRTRFRQVSGVSCGAAHLVAVCSDGSVHTWAPTLLPPRKVPPRAARKARPGLPHSRARGLR